MNKQRWKILLLAAFIAVIGALRFSPVGDALTFENLNKHRQELLDLVHDRYLLSVLSYLLVYIMVVALTLPGAAVLTIFGGFLFGTAAGVLYVNISATTGAVISFLSSRYLLGSRLQERYSVQLHKFNEELAKSGVHYLLTLRFIPLFPFFLINFLSGLTKIPLKTFLWTTSLGILPSSTVFAFAGRQIGSIRSPREILSKNVLLALAALALLTLLPLVYRRMRRRREA